MSVFDDYPFQYSHPVDSSELPEGYFHILPCRMSSLKINNEAIEETNKEWIKAVGKHISPAALDGKTLSNFLHVYPECPPSRQDPVLKFATIVGLWDGKSSQHLCLKRVERTILNRE